MPTLFSDPKKVADVVFVERATTDPFANSDDITTNKPCRVTQIHATIPEGETAAIDHISSNSNSAPLRAGIVSGTFYVGSPFLLFPGETLRLSTQNVQNGTRELVLKAEKVGV